jgi:hypothetical protein
MLFVIENSSKEAPLSQPRPTLTIVIDPEGTIRRAIAREY